MAKKTPTKVWESKPCKALTDCTLVIFSDGTISPTDNGLKDPITLTEAIELREQLTVAIEWLLEANPQV